MANRKKGTKEEGRKEHREIAKGLGYQCKFNFYETSQPNSFIILSYNKESY